MRMLILLLAVVTTSVLEAKTRLYLIPGTGADERLFHSLDLSEFDTVNVRLVVPHKRESMAQYAQRVAYEQIDTTEPFALLGVSLGGMIATELAALYNPLFTVIIASAKTKKELPIGYRMNRFLPMHRLIGGRTMKTSTKLLQPIYEPMQRKQRELFKSMISQKDPRFLNRAVEMIVTWDRTTAPERIIHIHGTKDRTLPFRRVDPTHPIENGTHMLVYSQPETVDSILSKLATRVEATSSI